MTIQEVNKICTSPESKAFVIDQTNEIIELEVSYRNKWIYLLAETQVGWAYSSSDPESLDKEYHDEIREILAVKAPNDELGEDEVLDFTDEELETINDHFRGWVND